MSEILLDLAKKNYLSPQEKIRKQNIEKGKVNFREYCNLMNPNFFMKHRKYQDLICNTIQDIYEKKIINPETGEPYDILILNMPPGSGKSYTTSMFATWAFGQNVKNQIISISYNQTLSTKFAKTVRNSIQDKQVTNDNNSYVATSFFPNLKIKDGDGAMDTWSLDGYYDSYLATSFDGSLTGMRGTIAIIDDPIKNHKEAVNERIKQEHWDFFTGTLPSRILDGGLQIIILTRWATDDLAGKIMSDPEYSKRYYKLELTALDEDTDQGVSFCEDLYSTKNLQGKRRGMLSHIWEANFMQKPVDLKGALYGEFKTYDVAPEFERLCAYIDTADTGTDYLCAILFGVYCKQAYILDIYYTQDSMEKTEKETARRLNIYSIREVAIESNNGGRGFARNVKRILKEFFSNFKCIVKWFHQSQNKLSRILVNAANVMEDVIMPENWEKKYPEFSKDIKKFQSKGKNEHDDCADTITGVVEILQDEIKIGSKLSVLKSKNRR